MNATTAERLDGWLTRAAAAGPDRRALVMGGQAVAYGDLEAAVNRYARLLIDQGCRPGDRVAVLAAKSPATVTTLLAVLRAGGVYVPIDSASPAARIDHILTSAEPSILLTDARAAPVVDDLVAAGGLKAQLTVGSVEGPVIGERFATRFSSADAAGLDSGPPPLPAAPPDVAHLLYTSGSTGIPKGVMITHANVRLFVTWAVEYFGLRSGDRHSLHTPLHFDLSTFDIFGTLAAGAELHLVPPELNLDARGLAAFISDSQLTHWFSVPAVLGYLKRFDAVSDGDFPALRQLLWCGEVLPTPVLRYWMDRLRHVRFTNLYGPTEATIASSYHTVADCPEHDTDTVPIGVPCEGEELLVLDASRQPVPAGETGDLYIAGPGLSPGYWRDPTRTAAAFVEDPRRPGSVIYRTGDLARLDRDETFWFLGRADFQIKHRGYRIELGEIETALAAVSGLDEYAVVAVPTDGFEGTTICCAYRPGAPGDPAPAQIRQQLSRMVPVYMLPTRWMELDRLPRNVNGKIDRPDIKDRFRARSRRGRQRSASAPPG